MQAFFTDRMINQKNASSHTIAACRDTMRLLLTFTSQQTAVGPYVLLMNSHAPPAGRILSHERRESRPWR